MKRAAAAIGMAIVALALMSATVGAAYAISPWVRPNVEVLVFETVMGQYPITARLVSSTSGGIRVHVGVATQFVLGVTNVAGFSVSIDVSAFADHYPSITDACEVQVGASPSSLVSVCTPIRAPVVASATLAPFEYRQVAFYVLFPLNLDYDLVIKVSVL